MDALVDRTTDLRWSDWSAVIGIVTGVGGLLAAFIFYIKGKKEKDPCWTVSSYTVVSTGPGNLEGLDVLYRGTRVDRLSFARITLWNNGREPIDGEDATKGDPLRIAGGEGFKLLDAKVVAVNSESQPKGRFDDQSGIAYLDFSFLNQGDAISYQVVHDGGFWDHPSIKGNVRGAKGVRLVDSYVSRRIDPFPLGDGEPSGCGVRGVVASLAIFLALFTVVLLLLSFVSEHVVGYWRELAVTTAVVLLIGLVLGYVESRKDRRPKGMRPFGNEVAAAGALERGERPARALQARSSRRKHDSLNPREWDASDRTDRPK